MHKSLFDIPINPYFSHKQFQNEALRRSTSLPKDIRLSLHKFSHHGNSDGYILFPRIALENVNITTPASHKEAKERNCFISESVLSIFGNYLGTLFAYEQESNSSYFNNIRPTIKNKNEQSSESSNVFLELHTEMAFHEIIPDFVLLYCLKEDRNYQAETGVASIRNVIKKLTKKSILELTKNQYKISADLSFIKNNNIKNKKTIPILYGSIEDPYMIYDADTITCCSTKSQLALNELDELLRKEIKLINLKSGDLIIIDNRRSVHSRSEFTAYLDGNDRWLQRSFIKTCCVTPEKLLQKKLTVVDLPA